MKYKHMSFDNRLDIEKGLKENLSFKQILNILTKILLLSQKKLKII